MKEKNNLLIPFKLALLSSIVVVSQLNAMQCGDALIDIQNETNYQRYHPLIDEMRRDRQNFMSWLPADFIYSLKSEIGGYLLREFDENLAAKKRAHRHWEALIRVCRRAGGNDYKSDTAFRIVDHLIEFGVDINQTSIFTDGYYINPGFRTNALEEACQTCHQLAYHLIEKKGAQVKCEVVNADSQNFSGIDAEVASCGSVCLAIAFYRKNKCDYSQRLIKILIDKCPLRYFFDPSGIRNIELLNDIDSLYEHIDPLYQYAINKIHQSLQIVLSKSLEERKDSIHTPLESIISSQTHSDAIITQSSCKEHAQCLLCKEVIQSDCYSCGCMKAQYHLRCIIENCKNVSPKYRLTLYHVVLNDCICKHFNN